MKQIAAILVCLLILLFPSELLALGNTQDKDKIAALSGKYEKLENQQVLIEKQIKSAKTEKERQLLQIQQIGRQIEATEGQIALLDERIALIEGYVDRKEEELREKQEAFSLQYEAFCKRLNAIARIPEMNMLGVALGTDSYFSFVTSRTAMERAIEYDRVLLDTLTREKKEIESISKDMQENRDQVLRDQAQLDGKRQALGQQMAQVQQQIQDIALMEEQFSANKDALRRHMEQVQAEIDLVYAEIARKAQQGTLYLNGADANGSMGHPSPQLTQITSSYGLRFGNSNFHTGIDFSAAGAYGKPVLAAADAKVAFVNTAYTPGYGYGKYVILDHGGGITTLYAHCSSIEVRVGQRVKRGDLIAKIGSTGWSTGPHCHFEVRVNGVHTNPLPYLQGAAGS